MLRFFFAIVGAALAFLASSTAVASADAPQPLGGLDLMD